MSPRVRRALFGMLAGGIVALAAPGLLFGPYIRDDFVLDRIVRAVALDWRDFGEAEARSRLQHELDQRAIGLHVRDDDCILTALPDGPRQVRCAWEVDVVVPLAGVVIPLAFASEAGVSASGDLVP